MNRRLSVNVNKIALLRNSRTTGVPDILAFCDIARQAGARGITVHPRPDERHIRSADLTHIADYVKQWDDFELNIEGFPDDRLLDFVSRVKPDQVTLVPDAPNVLTSEKGWVFNEVERQIVKDFIASSKGKVGRVSVFLDPYEDCVAEAAEIGVDRIEVYTGAFARDFTRQNFQEALEACAQLASRAKSLGLGVNAGHDLNRANLGALLKAAPEIGEVSIGHELIADALLEGFSVAVSSYVEVLRSNDVRLDTHK